MLTGFNTDFRYKGTVYHVQTEDNGLSNPVIVTLLYRGGAILASRKTSYADILKFNKLEQVVREIMEEQHKQVIKDLVAGQFAAKEENLPKPEMPAPDLSAAPVGEDQSGTQGGDSRRGQGEAFGGKRIGQRDS